MNVKKQYLTPGCANSGRNFIRRVLLPCADCDLRPFCRGCTLKKLVVIFLLMYIFVTGVWHLVGTFPLLIGHQVCVACLAWRLLSSTTEMPPAVLFCLHLIVGYTHSALWLLQSQTSLLLTLMSSWLSLNFCPEGIWWGKAGSAQLT